MYDGVWALRELCTHVIISFSFSTIKILGPLCDFEEAQARNFSTGLHDLNRIHLDSFMRQLSTSANENIFYYYKDIVS